MQYALFSTRDVGSLVGVRLARLLDIAFGNTLAENSPE
jgi:hypothetical protein